MKCMKWCYLSPDSSSMLIFFLLVLPGLSFSGNLRLPSPSPLPRSVSVSLLLSELSLLLSSTDSWTCGGMGTSARSLRGQRGNEFVQLTISHLHPELFMPWTWEYILVVKTRMHDDHSYCTSAQAPFFMWCIYRCNMNCVMSWDLNKEWWIYVHVKMHENRATGYLSPVSS